MILVTERKMFPSCRVSCRIDWLVDPISYHFGSRVVPILETGDHLLYHAPMQVPVNSEWPSKTSCLGSRRLKHVHVAVNCQITKYLLKYLISLSLHVDEFNQQTCV